MTLRGIQLLSVVVLTTFAGAQLALAEDASPAPFSFKTDAERVSEQFASLECAKRALDAKPAAEWTNDDIDQYLTCAFWAVCYGMYSYVHDEHRVPATAEEMTAAGSLPFWPGNPLRDWEPLRILALEDGFSAGDLVLQICPPEYYSGLANPVPRSFELGIYGRDEDSVPPANYDPTLRSPWVVVPAGLLTQGGMHSTPYTKTRQKWARRKQEQKAEDIQN